NPFDAEEIGPDDIEIILGKHIKIKPKKHPDLIIPINDYGVMYLDFVGDTIDYQSASFSEVNKYNNTQVISDLIKDKIVLIGLTATGSTDIGPIPVNNYAPLVTVHMTAISNILTGTHILPTTHNEQLIILLIIFLISFPIAVFLRPRYYIYVYFLFCMIYCTIVYMGISYHYKVFPIVIPLTYLSLGLFFHLLIHFIIEERERKKVRGMFETMVSKDVLQYIEENPGSFSLKGEAREATIFFSDVAGFTTISETLTPELLVGLLNEYLTPMSEIITESRGYIDKYEGDAIMAVWGVPYSDDKHAISACLAAIDQQKKLCEIRDFLEKKYGHRLWVRMGINSGTVSAGNMGSLQKMQYTVMGDAVNQAARFEPACKDYGIYTMIGQTTYELAKEHIEVRLLDKIVVKGKTIPIIIYELMDRKGHLDIVVKETIHNYEEALKLHWERKFDAALEFLEKALILNSDDGPSNAMKIRITGYLENPPSDNWQGEYVKATKD
ncbi:MAG: adenylate/guanylate cyclase domain-containing protein, partial [Lentisphaeria bacterium]|nr:adenylate/guanylate cyclase domain-containing protein [Lentisphaeria bacterium]